MRPNPRQPRFSNPTTITTNTTTPITLRSPLLRLQLNNMQQTQ
jgi:hypothetical protein